MRKFNVISDSDRIKPHFIFSIVTSTETFTIGRFYENEEENQLVMSDLADTLDRMKSKYPNGKSGMGSYSDVKGFERWFIGLIDDFYDNLTTNYAQEFYEDFEWPCDKYGNQSELLSYEVNYVDSFGRKHPVEIE